MRESSLVFRPYLVCPLYLLALLTSATKFVGEPNGEKTMFLGDNISALTTQPGGRDDPSARRKVGSSNLKNRSQRGRRS